MYKGQVAFNTAFTDFAMLTDSSTGSYLVNPTIAAGDVVAYLDSTYLGNLDTLPDVVPVAGKQVRIQGSAAETNGTKLTVLFHDQTIDSEWDDLVLYYDISTTLNLSREASINDAGASSSTFTTTLTGLGDNFLESGPILALVSGNLKSLSRPVTDYTSSTGSITVTPAFPAAPDNSSVFKILGYYG